MKKGKKRTCRKTRHFFALGCRGGGGACEEGERDEDEDEDEEFLEAGKGAASADEGEGEGYIDDEEWVSISIPVTPLDITPPPKALFQRAVAATARQRPQCQ
jgi:hypothetical protein